MTSEPIKCPCCGQVAVSTNQVRVNIDTNTLFYRCRKVALTPQETELAFILARRLPAPVAPVAHDAIIAQLWGDSEPENATSQIRVLVCHMRKKLLSVSLGISNYQERGYAMTVLPVLVKTERSTQPAEALRAQA